VPAVGKVTENFAPGATVPEFHVLVFEVVVCDTVSVFFQVTVSPTATSATSGLNAVVVSPAAPAGIVTGIPGPGVDGVGMPGDEYPDRHAAINISPAATSGTRPTNSARHVPVKTPAPSRIAFRVLTICSVSLSATRTNARRVVHTRAWRDSGTCAGVRLVSPTVRGWGRAARASVLDARASDAVGTRVTPDVLSDVLQAVRLTGAVYFDFFLSSPWVMEAPASRDIAAQVMPGAQRVMEYHCIARGTAWAQVAGHEPIRLREGDLILFPQGHAHVLSSAPGMPSEPDLSAFARVSPKLPMVYEMGGGGPGGARIVCCFLGCDERPYNPLLTALPAVIHLPATGHQAAAGWLATLLSAAPSESEGARAGGQNVLARLSELMFVETIRWHLETLPPAETGWLAGLRDPVVGQALAALHGAAIEPWTVQRLAKTVGVSRSVLADRFMTMVGQPPMQYLALWRMQLASRLLLGGGQVAAVAAAVGYESEAAFSRAFKKLVGRAPATWKREAAGRRTTGV